MGRYLARPAVDEDLMRSANWIALDNPEAAERFLAAAFESFELLAGHPAAGAKARLKQPRLREVRFWVLSPPFNRWLVFYRIEAGSVVIGRVLHSAQDWREEAEGMF